MPNGWVSMDNLCISARHRRTGAGSQKRSSQWRARRRGRRQRGGPGARRARGEMGDSHVGLQARLMGRRCASCQARSNIEHRRDLHQPAPRENRRHVWQPGDDHRRSALRFYASVQSTSPHQAIKFKDEILGSRTRVKVTRIRSPRPSARLEIDLMYDHGFSKESDVLDLGVESGVIEKRCLLPLQRRIIGQGRENAQQYLRDNPDFMRPGLQIAARTTSCH